MTNHDIHRAQEAVMPETQFTTEKPVREGRSKKSQGAASAETVDFKKLAQETREKMAGKKNPPSSETVAEAAQVQEPAPPMPAYARFQVGQVLGVKAGDDLPGNWTGVMMKFVEPEVYIVRYRRAGKTFEGEFKRSELSMMPHPAVGMRLEVADLVGVRGLPQFGIVSHFDERKDRASVMIAGQTVTRDFSLEELDFHGSQLVERSLKFVGLETFAQPEGEQATEAIPEAPTDTYFAVGDFVKVQQKEETLLAGVQAVHTTPPVQLGVSLAGRGERTVVPARDCTVTHVRPVAPLQPGDLVHLSLRMGVWEVVSQEGDVVNVVNPLDANEKASSPISGILVTRRKNDGDMRADLGYTDQALQQEDMPFPEAGAPGEQSEPLEALTPTQRPGWIFPRGQHLAHWWNGEKALCGREVADGISIESNSDPNAYADRTCRKCRAALNKQAPVQAAPEPVEPPAANDIPVVINNIPEALTVALPVQEIAQPVQTIAQPVLEVAQPELTVELPQSSRQQPIPSELPGTPTLLSPAGIQPGTLGVVDAPLAQTVKSPCNVRMHYDDVKVSEIAASIKADGQLQECVGRWNDQGQLEIVAGETRRRAQLHRQEQGETNLTLRVNVKELTDAQALRISAQENMARKDMTPLEECEAMLRMQEAGDTVENIQATFGYKSAQPVADRILVAKNLSTSARDALDSREISLAQAFVIARAPGDDLQKNMLSRAQGSYQSSAGHLAEMLTKGQFLVKHAEFDVGTSGLDVKRDLFDAFEPFFDSKPRALEAQLAWAEQKAEKLRKKGKHAFVDVVVVPDSHYNLTFGHSKYEREYDTKSKERGLVLHIHEYNGEFTEVSDVRLKASKKITTTKADGTTTTETVREMPASAFETAHLLKAQALRHSLLGHPQATLVLTVHGLIAGFASNGKAPIGSLEAWNGNVSTPEIQAKLTSWQTAIAAGTGETPVLGNLAGDYRHRWSDEFNLKLYDYLSSLDTPELLDLLNVLVACRIYEPHTEDYRKPQAKTFTRLAQQTDANAYLASTFKLTDEWLKRYPRHELVALAEEAGLGRALVEDCGTLKEMRGRILEHADALHREGFVPKFVRFAEAPTARVTDSSAD